MDSNRNAPTDANVVSASSWKSVHNHGGRVGGVAMGTDPGTFELNCDNGLRNPGSEKIVFNICVPHD